MLLMTIVVASDGADQYRVNLVCGIINKRLSQVVSKYNNLCKLC